MNDPLQQIKAISFQSVEPINRIHMRLLLNQLSATSSPQWSQWLTTDSKEALYKSYKYAPIAPLTRKIGLQASCYSYETNRVQTFFEQVTSLIILFSCFSLTSNYLDKQVHIQYLPTTFLALHNSKLRITYLLFSSTLVPKTFVKDYPILACIFLSNHPTTSIFLFFECHFITKNSIRCSTWH